MSIVMRVVGELLAQSRKGPAQRFGGNKQLVHLVGVQQHQADGLTG
jgi:hypothetical protein